MLVTNLNTPIIMMLLFLNNPRTQTGALHIEHFSDPYFAQRNQNTQCHILVELEVYIISDIFKMHPTTASACHNLLFILL